MHRAWWNATIKEEEAQVENSGTAQPVSVFPFVSRKHAQQHNTPESRLQSNYSQQRKEALKNARQMRFFLFFCFVLGFFTGAQLRTWKNPNGTIKLILSSMRADSC